MPLKAPCAAEADVCEADGAPGEDAGETGEGLHPDKGGGRFFADGDEGEEAEGGGEADGDEGPALAVDVGEHLGGLALFGEGAEGARGAVDGGVADGEDGDHDDDVHDGVEAFDAGVCDGDDEWGGFGVGGRGADQARVGVGH